MERSRRTAVLPRGASRSDGGRGCSYDAPVGWPVEDRGGAVVGREELAGRERLDPAKALENRHELMLLSLRDSDDRAPLAREIFDEIAIGIVEGRLQPGDTLNTVELARRFGTSRTPVREALAGLERHGVVVVPRHRRSYVAPVSLKQVRDIYVLRASLFSLVSELIVEYCPDDLLDDLWDWQAALEEDAAREAVDEYFWHNVGFRLVEMRLSGNEELQRMVTALGIRTLQFRHVSLSKPGRIRHSAQEHRRLLEAYRARDREGAVGATRRLIMAGFDSLQQSEIIVGSSPAVGGRGDWR